MVWATYSLGYYDGEWGHQEYIFLKAFEIAPKKFSWVIREDLPNRHTLAGAFQTAVRNYRTLFLKRDEGKITTDRRADNTNFYSLSEEGKNWCIAYQGLLSNLYGETAKSKPKKADQMQLQSIENSEPFKIWLSDTNSQFNKLLLAPIFSCTPNSTKDDWRASLQLAKAQTPTEKKEILEFLQAVSEFIDL